jgi:NUMOD3 motif
MTPKEYAALPRPDKRGSPEHRKKISDAKKGCTFTEEARAKMSAAAKGRPKSEEHRRKIGEGVSLARRK